MQEQIPEWLTKLRKEKGLTRKELVEKICRNGTNLSYNYYYKIETGERALIDVNYVIREGIRKALEIDVETWKKETRLLLPFDASDGEKQTLHSEIQFLQDNLDLDTFFRNETVLKSFALDLKLLGDLQSIKLFALEVFPELYFEYGLFESFMPSILIFKKVKNPPKKRFVLTRTKKAKDQAYCYGIRRMKQSKGIVYKNQEEAILYLPDATSEEVMGVLINTIGMPGR